MPGRGMTTLTELRWTTVQQGRLVRAVRYMAGSTVFSDRLVFEQKWSAFLSMTRITGIVDGSGKE
jgi:hypothetical protein